MSPRMTTPAPSAAHVQQMSAKPAELSPLLEGISEETHAKYGAELFAPRTRSELREEADTMYRAGLLKKYLPRDADAWPKEARYAYATNRALIAFLAGAELGLLPLQAVRGIYFVEDQPYPAAKTLVGLIKKRHDICEYWYVKEASDVAFEIVTKRRGSPKEESLRVTIEQFAKLKDEKNYKGEPKRPPWTLYPSRQLAARCASWLAGQTYQDITLGFYAAEEMSSAVWERKYGDVGRALVQIPAAQDSDTVLDEIVADTPADGRVEAPPPAAAPETPPVAPDPLAEAAALAEQVKALHVQIEALGPGMVKEAQTIASAVRALPECGERRGLARALEAKGACVRGEGGGA
jgi:hypothetical protein